MTQDRSAHACPTGILRFDPPTTPPAVDHPRPDRLEAGCPRRETWTLYESAPQGLSAGIWTCEVGRWRIVFPVGKHEYFFVLEGHVRLHDHQGGFTDVVAGQGAVIPGGFEGAFEVLVPVRKHFVVIDQA
ncbi:MAG TPA: cupin domain-containing protein [Aquabacterium sp.]|uniref:cupin domain-containing protein n=1 Tax=Aquabacterium sp. TaxID=1872578 RepID=UPI002E355AE8|nr:cupin domain-containing protein [Aquabacterium sp.]HEX5373438.1 cupin domain-containing protein [Aquabacterium sp.]